MTVLSQKKVLMSTVRQSRAQDTRASIPVHNTVSYDFEQNQLLNTRNIPPRPGYEQRWVRTYIRGEQDQSNVMKKFNHGWRPRLANTIPDGQFAANVDFQGASVIGIHGMILVERPAEIGDKQRAAIRQDIDLQMAAVQQQLYGDMAGFKKVNVSFENESKSFKGRIAEIDD